MTRGDGPYPSRDALARYMDSPCVARASLLPASDAPVGAGPDDIRSQDNFLGVTAPIGLSGSSYGGLTCFRQLLRSGDSWWVVCLLNHSIPVNDPWGPVRAAEAVGASITGVDQRIRIRSR